MTEISRDELLGIALQTGLGFAAGGPPRALVQGGLAFANALFVNPEPQAGPSRDGLPNEAITSQEPVHGWDLIGPGRVGGLIALCVLAHYRRQRTARPGRGRFAGRAWVLGRQGCGLDQRPTGALFPPDGHLAGWDGHLVV